MTKAEKLLKEAQRLAAEAPTWADLSNALFDQREGIVARAFRTAEERKAFIETPQYRAIRALLSDSMEKTGVLEGATPRKSGKFVVRLPSSLHAALEREASREGVSLNQLVVAKLAYQLGAIAGH